MLCAAATILVAAVYSVVALFDRAPMNVPVFLGWLGVLVAVNAFFCWKAWQERARLSLQAQMLAIYWGGIALWYWLPAPLYYLLTMNLDRLQLRWAAFAFFWEVPVVGGAFVWFAWLLFRPLRRYLAGSDPHVTPAKLYDLSLRYPTLIALVIMVFSVVGYVIGAGQVRIFAFFPALEQMKNLLHGVATAIFVAVFYNVALDALLGPVRSQIAREFGIAQVAVRTVERRVFGVGLVIALGGIVLVSLFAIQAFQRMVSDGLEMQVQEELASLPPQLPHAEMNLSRVPRLGEHGSLRVVGDPQQLPADQLSPETRAQIDQLQSGTVEDFRSDLKVLGWVTRPDLRGKLVATVYVEDFYAPLWTAVAQLVFASLFALLLSVGILAFASSVVTRSIRSLTAAVRAVDAGAGDETELQTGTADEIEELSQAFARYVHQSRTALSELDAFSYSVSHDLRAPLRSIDGFGGLLERRYGDRLDAEGRHYLDRLRLATRHMGELIDDLLSLSRVTRTDPARERVDLTRLSRTIAADLQQREPDRDVKWMIEEGMVSYCDPQLIRLVLGNLLENAWKFTSKHPWAHIEVRSEKFDGEPAFVVRDDGVGFDMTYAHKLFGAFQRLHSTSEFEGSGIGLATVHRAIARHGGRVWAHGEVDKGAAFYFTLHTEGAAEPPPTGE